MNQTNPTQTADQYYNQLSDKENQYYNSLSSQYGNNNSLILNHLDAQHKLAVGTDDQAQAKFLENIANAVESQQGRNQYDYNLGTQRENQSYGLQNTALNQNHANALAKLNNDDFTQRQTLQGQQGVANQGLAEDLNSRGLLYGQAPQGTNQIPSSTNPQYQPLTGLGGVAGVNAGVQNNQYNNQFGALSRNLNLNTQSENNAYNQNQNTLGFNHTNTLQDLTTTARRNAQDESQGYNYNTGMQNLNYQQQMAQLQRQKAASLLQDKQYSYQLGGQNQGTLGY